MLKPGEVGPRCLLAILAGRSPSSTCGCSPAVWSVNLATAGMGLATFVAMVAIPQVVILPASTGFGFGQTATVAAGLA